MPAVKSATMKSTTASREASASSTAHEPTACYRSVIKGDRTATHKARPAVESTATIIAASVVTPAAIEPAPIISAPVKAPAITVEPRTRADEQAADKPIRTVIPIRRAGIRIISVVPISTNRRGTVCVRRSIPTEANADRDSLRVRVTRAHQANRQKQSSYSCKS